MTKKSETLNNANDIVVYRNGELSLPVEFSLKEETVWLKAEDMGLLFNVQRPAIVKHISNILRSGELDSSTCSILEQVQKEGNRRVKRAIKRYNLDMIISVGYRVNSKRGIEFRKWANHIIKDYMMKGVAINEKRLAILNKTVDIQNRMLAATLDIDTQELSSVIDAYGKGLDCLDDYDHQCLKKPKGHLAIHELTYEESRNLIDKMKFGKSSTIFGVEREPGKLEGILKAIDQSFDGKDLYPTAEEKAAHLLYFLIKDHPFVDGCKRIGATLFLEFLSKNKILASQGTLDSLFTNGTLVALTLLIAESNPDEMEVMVTLVMNLL
jgi:prophage maintenance system killer protein